MSTLTWIGAHVNFLVDKFFNKGILKEIITEESMTMGKKPKSELLENFRAALKAEVSDLEKRNGRGVKAKLARDADVAKAYLNDIAMKRKPGSEEVRHRIAKALTYSYSDFQSLGSEILNGKSLDDARKVVAQRRLLQPKEDGYIEKILKIWSDLNKKDKGKLVKHSLILQFRNWKKFPNIKEYPKNSKERFDFIWGEICSDYGFKQALFDESYVDLIQKYTDGKMTDMVVFGKAKDFAETIR